MINQINSHHKIYIKPQTLNNGQFRPINRLHFGTNKDVFSKKISLKANNTIPFKGSCCNTLKQLTRLAPETKEILNKVLEGEHELIPALESKIADAISAGKLSSDDINPISKALISEVVNNNYDCPTENKTITLIKLNALFVVVVDRLNSYSKSKEAKADWLPFRRKDAEEIANKTQSILKHALELKSPGLRENARKQIKETLIKALKPDVHPLVKENALMLLDQFELINEKEDIKKLIGVIQSGNNTKHSVEFILSKLPEYIQNNKIEDADKEELLNSALSALNSLRFTSNYGGY
ncbi:MAG: hypothetical protein AB1782_12090 [Cyanobacteriota bacterium]